MLPGGVSTMRLRKSGPRKGIEGTWGRSREQAADHQITLTRQCRHPAILDGRRLWGQAGKNLRLSDRWFILPNGGTAEATSAALSVPLNGGILTRLGIRMRLRDDGKDNDQAHLPGPLQELGVARNQ